MFAYCNNNPITLVDFSGGIPKELSIYSPAMYIDGGSSFVLNTYSASPKSTTQTNSLHDNHNYYPNNVFHEQLFAIETSNPSFSLLDSEVSLGAFSLTVITGGWETKNFDLSLLDLGKLALEAGYREKELNVSAMASIWAPSITITIKGVSVAVSAHVGSIGGTFNVGNGKFKAGAAYGWGVSLAFDW